MDPREEEDDSCQIDKAGSIEVSLTTADMFLECIFRASKADTAFH